MFFFLKPVVSCFLVPVACQDSAEVFVRVSAQSIAGEELRQLRQGMLCLFDVVEDGYEKTGVEGGSLKPGLRGLKKQGRESKILGWG